MPRVRIHFPTGRRYPGLPLELERDIITLEVLEGLLGGPLPDASRVVCVPSY
jgi:hypothetical protein